MVIIYLGHHKVVNKPTFTTVVHLLQFLLQGGDHHGVGGQGEGSVGQRLPRASLLSLLCQSRSRHDPKRRSLFIKGTFSFTSANLIKKRRNNKNTFQKNLSNNIVVVLVLLVGFNKPFFRRVK